MEKRRGKSKKKFGIFVIMIFAVSQFLYPVSAAENYDDIAPVVKSFKIVNPNNVDGRRAGKHIFVDFDLVEDGTGITAVALVFRNKQGDEFTADAMLNSNNVVYTGKTRVELVPDDTKKVKSGVYQVISAYVEDANYNASSYSANDGTSVIEKGTKEVTVTKTDYKGDIKSKAPILNSVKFHALGKHAANQPLVADFNIKVQKGKLRGIDIQCHQYEDENIIVSLSPSDRDIEKGTMNLKIPLKYQDKGKYVIDGITLADTEDNSKFYPANTSAFGGISPTFEITTENMVPELLSFSVVNTSLKTPDVLAVDINLKTDLFGVDGMNIYVEDEKGKQRDFYWGDSTGLYTKLLYAGKQRIYIPVGPFWGVGTFHITGINVWGEGGKHKRYEQEESEYAGSIYKIPGFKDEKITVKSGYDVVYHTGAGNVSAIVKKIKQMKNGETIVLDCRNDQIASKKIFEALCGANKTVIFEDDDVQWVFNGKKIKKSRCKDIDLTRRIDRVSGTSYGYANDKYLLYMEYADNGVLPGEVVMRINEAYLYEKYNVSDSNLLLSYYDGTGEVLKNKVKIAKDAFIEYRITHNSTYLLSKHGPRLTSPKKLKISRKGKKNIKLSWNKVGGANGYYVYRAGSKNGSYKRIATRKGKRSTTYTDTHTKYGKRYYYRIKAKAKKRSIKASYSEKVTIVTRKK